MSMPKLLAPRTFALTAAFQGGRIGRNCSTPQRRLSAMAPAAELTFYDSGSCPYAHRAWLALEEKQVPYKTVKVDLQNRTDEFKDLHRSVGGDPKSNGKVPILIDGDATLIESTPIVEYLEAKYPDSGAKLLPEDPLLRYKVKLFAETFTEKMTVMPLLRASTKAELEEAKEKLRDGLKIHAVDAEPGYFLGNTYSWAETITTPFLRRYFVVLPKARGVNIQGIIDSEGLTRFDKWAKATLARKSNKETGPSDDDLAKGWEKFVTPLKDA